jgi:hypothetical protein
MIFQNGTTSFDEYIPLIMIGVLLVADIFILKFGLIITKAESKRNLKWVAISFLIQFGAIFFISLPTFLMGMTGEFDEGPNPGIIIPIVLLSVFIDINLINVIHKIGIKRSVVVSFLILVPIIAAMVFLGQYMSPAPNGA